MIESSYQIGYPPGWLLMVGGLVLAFVGPLTYRALVLALPLLVLWLTLGFVPSDAAIEVGGLSWSFSHAHPGGQLFAIVFSLMTSLGALYAWKQPRSLELPAAFIYAGAAMSTVYAGSLPTVLLYWEVMAVASTVVIAVGGQPNSGKAALRYAGFHLLGGAIFFAGVALHWLSGGSLAFASLMQAEPLAKMIILCGVLVNSGAPPLGAWLADAYPEGSVSGSVFLSAFTTKTTVFVLSILFPGEPLLITVGIIMIFYGILWAILENDVRRILSYSIVNQVGFMICAIGIGTPLAISGAYAHAFAHIIYKALLLMSAGAVLHATGMRKCTEVGGLWRTMPLTAVCGTIGALAISAVPLTSGFTTKSMITDAAGAQGLTWVWLALVAASAGVFLHAGIKFPYFVFFHKPSHLVPKSVPWNMKLAMVLAAAGCIYWGLWPQSIHQMLPIHAAQVGFSYEAYSAQHVVYQIQLLGCSAVAFFAMLPLLKRTQTISLDSDWLYRKLLPTAAEVTLVPVLRESERLRLWAAQRIESAFMSLSEASAGTTSPRPRMFVQDSLTIIIGVLSAMLLLYLM